MTQTDELSNTDSSENSENKTDKDNDQTSEMLFSLNVCCISFADMVVKLKISNSMKQEKGLRYSSITEKKYSIR